MGLQNAKTETLPQDTSRWRVLAKAVQGLLRRSSPERAASTAKGPAPAGGQIVGVKKSAIYKDGCGQIRTIDLFLPADLLTELARPLDLKFLDGEELVTAEQLSRAIASNFSQAEGRD
jgi:hypothetical protein